MKKQLVLWTAVIVLSGIAVFALGRLSVDTTASREPSGYSLSPGAVGMISGGTGYLYYDFAVSGVVPAEELVAEIQRYLDRQGNPDLALARLREFDRVYQAEIIERSTGRHAFGLMLSRSTLQISPKAGPNIFWNTKYGPMIAEIGGGYGMLGRLVPKEFVGEMTLSKSTSQRIAQEAVKELGAGLELNNEIATFYGFYEFHVTRNGEVVGELDVNGYNGQVWYKDWGEPQSSVQDFVP